MNANPRAKQKQPQKQCPTKKKTNAKTKNLDTTSRLIEDLGLTQGAPALASETRV
jgi:hypothetical protein